MIAPKCRWVTISEQTHIIPIYTTQTTHVYIYIHIVYLHIFWKKFKLSMNVHVRVDVWKYRLKNHKKTEFCE